MSQGLEFDDLVTKLREILGELPEHRQGKNIKYSIIDAAMSAFAVFFTQTPSFLAYQQTMQCEEGRNNAASLFQITSIPCDNQIRALLDPLKPNLLDPMFKEIWQRLLKQGELAAFQVLNEQWLIAMDGTGYFSSRAIHCPNCQHRTSANGQTSYFHTAITPVLVAPGRSQVINLAPEFIVPQDGHEKQDCERMAAKRWLEQHASEFPADHITLLGDDLYSNQPLCELIRTLHLNFIFTCKPSSHPILYEWVDSLTATRDVSQVTLRRWNGRFAEIIQARFVEDVPLRDGEDAMLVNWFELTITHSKTGETLYHNSFVTNHPITEQTVIPLSEAGRTRWKNENEHNNTLKTKGYHLEHNFGHGQQHLASFLLSLNLLAFLFHTVLEVVDDNYRRLRQKLGARQTFFNDLKTLTRYLFFDNWSHLMNFMIKQLQLVPLSDSS